MSLRGLRVFIIDFGNNLELAMTYVLYPQAEPRRLALKNTLSLCGCERQIFILVLAEKANLLGFCFFRYGLFAVYPGSG